VSKIVIIDAGGANTGSVRAAFSRLGVDAPLVTDAASILDAERVILPGVGTAKQVMTRLYELNLVATLKTLKIPLLGICVGMQVLFEHSEEDSTDCLGILPGKVRKLAESPGLRIPHMGWNTLQPLRPSRLLTGIENDARAYFVHSYAANITEDCIAACEYGTRFAALVERGNIAGAQFHPERSADIGARLIANFIAREPGI